MVFFVLRRGAIPTRSSCGNNAAAMPRPLIETHKRRFWGSVGSQLLRSGGVFSLAVFDIHSLIILALRAMMIAIALDFFIADCSRLGDHNAASVLLLVESYPHLQ